MKIEDQVCTPGQSMRLQELGVAAESVLVYELRVVPFESLNIVIPGMIPDNWQRADEKYPAYSVAELGVMLPTGFDTMRVTGKTPGDLVWQGYDMAGRDFTKDPYYTEAECRAAMLIHLLENKLITVEEVNKRLCASQ